MPVGQREPAARRRSIAEPALFDLSRRCRCTEVDDPCTEYAPKQFYIKMVFRNSSRGRRPSSTRTSLDLTPLDSGEYVSAVSRTTGAGSDTCEGDGTAEPIVGPYQVQVAFPMIHVTRATLPEGSSQDDQWNTLLLGAP